MSIVTADGVSPPATDYWLLTPRSISDPTDKALNLAFAPDVTTWRNLARRRRFALDDREMFPLGQRGDGTRLLRNAVRAWPASTHDVMNIGSCLSRTAARPFERCDLMRPPAMRTKRVYPPLLEGMRSPRRHQRRPESSGAIGIRLRSARATSPSRAVTVSGRRANAIGRPRARSGRRRGRPLRRTVPGPSVLS